MAKASQLDDLAPRIPVRTIESEWDSDDRVTVHEPRQDANWLVKLVTRGMDPGTIHVTLDEVGSLVWSLCDGEHTVGAIARHMAEHFGEDFDPQSQRLAVFLLTMKQRGWLAWKPEE